jgi:hypothetical protein
MIAGIEEISDPASAKCTSGPPKAVRNRETT